MKLFSWNVNGIRAVQRKKLLRPFIEEHQPDILCIQETKAQPDQFKVEAPGYHMYWNSAKRRGHFGTGIMTKIEPLQVVNDIPENIAGKYKLKDQYGDTNTEGRVMAAEFDDFWVVTVYTPNAKDDLTRIPMRENWDPAFLEYCKKLNEDKPVIFCGDLNVAHTEDDLARPKENEGKKGFTREERNGFEDMVNAGFIDTFRLFNQGNGFYTWWSHWGGARERNVGWRIDYFMTSDKLKGRISDAQIHPKVMGSDHCPVSLVLSDE